MKIFRAIPILFYAILLTGCDALFDNEPDYHVGKYWGAYFCRYDYNDRSGTPLQDSVLLLITKGPAGKNTVTYFTLTETFDEMFGPDKKRSITWDNNRKCFYHVENPVNHMGHITSIKFVSDSIFFIRHSLGMPIPAQEILLTGIKIN